MINYDDPSDVLGEYCRLLSLDWKTRTKDIFQTLHILYVYRAMKELGYLHLI